MLSLFFAEGIKRIQLASEMTVVRGKIDNFFPRSFVISALRKESCDCVTAETWLALEMTTTDSGDVSHSD